MTSLEYQKILRTFSYLSRSVGLTEHAQDIAHAYIEQVLSTGKTQSHYFFLIDYMRRERGRARPDSEDRENTRARVNGTMANIDDVVISHDPWVDVDLKLEARDLFGQMLVTAKTDRDQLLIYLYFMEDYGIEALARRFSVSISRVHQIIREALIKAKRG